MNIINFDKAGHRFDWLDLFLQYMTAEQILNELFDAMSDDEADENCEFIARMNGIDYKEEEEEEEEEEGEGE